MFCKTFNVIKESFSVGTFTKQTVEKGDYLSALCIPGDAVA